MRFPPPSRARLAVTWAVLSALTVASMASGRAADDDGPPLGTAWVAVLLVLTALKAAGILENYLNLRTSSRAWRVGFHVLVGGLLAIILGAYAVGTVIRGR